MVALYIGESSRSFYDRALDHEKALKTQNPNYGIVKPWQECHPESEKPPEYQYKLIKKHRTCLERQIFEAITIEQVKCQLILNSKGEFGRNVIPRLQNLPDEEFSKPNPNQNAAKPELVRNPKRSANGFTKTPSNDTSEMYPSGAKPNLLPTPESFNGQYKQRKKLRLATQRPAQTNDHTHEQGMSKRPRMKPPSRASKYTIM